MMLAIERVFSPLVGLISVQTSGLKSGNEANRMKTLENQNRDSGELQS